MKTGKIKLRARNDDGSMYTEVIEFTDPLCDFCNAELKDEPGGGLFNRHAVCHDCWGRTVTDAIKYGEARFLKPCPDNKGLASWIRETCW